MCLSKTWQHKAWTLLIFQTMQTDLQVDFALLSTIYLCFSLEPCTVTCQSLTHLSKEVSTILDPEQFSYHLGLKINYLLQWAYSNLDKAGGAMRIIIFDFFAVPETGFSLHGYLRSC